jgi:pimeloyl-ACP methyl ester carboxylesterase
VNHVRTLDTVTGGCGVRIATRARGPADGRPIVLLHGWAQSSRAWTRQLAGPLADRFQLIAADLRGHGESDVPAGDGDRGGYRSTPAWADDVAALLDLAGKPAVLVGWSYGGLVIRDYLAMYGTARIAGIVLAGAITEIGRGHRGGWLGKAMRAALPAALSDDRAVAEPALRGMITGMAASRFTTRPSRTAEEMLQVSLRVPGFVRAGLFDRDVDSADVLAAIDVPTLIVHGRQDAIADPRAAEYAIERIPGATAHWLDGVGHLPFLDRADEFDEVVGRHADMWFGGNGAA